MGTVTTFEASVTAACFGDSRDDDNPELTDEQLASLRRVHESRRTDRRRQNVTLRLTPQTIQKAKAWEKDIAGY